MKILYFTATGNSLYIAKSMGGELLSVPQMIKEGAYEFTDEKIGIVFPVHGWGVPSYLVDFLKKATFNCDYLFAVATYGIYSGAVAKHLTDIGSEAGFRFDYINRIKMVDNYLPGFDMKKQVEEEPKKEIEKQLAAVKSDVASAKQWILKEKFLQKVSFKYMKSRENKPFSKKRLKKFTSMVKGLTVTYRWTIRVRSAESVPGFVRQATFPSTKKVERSRSVTRVSRVFPVFTTVPQMPFISMARSMETDS